MKGIVHRLCLIYVGGTSVSSPPGCNKTTFQAQPHTKQPREVNEVERRVGTGSRD